MWARALGAVDDLDATLGVALKVREDVERVRERGVLRVREVRRGRPACIAPRAARRGVGGRGRQVLAAHRALAAVEPRDVRLALRATLCTSAADVARLEVAFALVFGAARASAPWGRSSARALPRVAVPGASAGAGAGRSTLEAVPAAWSEEEQLRDSRLRRVHRRRARGRAAAARARGARAARCGARRRTRPRAAGPAAGPAATARASLRHGGELLDRRWRAPRERPRRVVLVSTSRARWRRTRGCCSSTCRRASRRAARVEAFAFGTRLTRLTPELAGRDPDRALARAAERGGGLERAGRGSATRWPR